MKYSLATLLLLTAIAALGMAGLVNATRLWTQVVVSAVVLVLIGATVVAVYAPRPRSFIGGFAVAGWVYFLLTATLVGGSARDYLVTTAALAKLYPVLHEKAPPQPGAWWGGPVSTGQQLMTFSDYSQLVWSGGSLDPVAAQFHAIGHALWTLLVGALGGILASFVRRRTSLECTT